MISLLLVLEVLAAPPKALTSNGYQLAASAAGNILTYSVPVLEAVPLALSRQCNLAEVPTVNRAIITDTRASQAYCSKSDGTFVLVAANQPRLGRMGLQIEPASTQLLTDVRDLSSSAWTKTNMVCVKNATGADGTVNGGTTCTAAGDGGVATVTQALTGLPSGMHVASASIQRADGGGTVSVTGNGVDFCDVTSALYVAMANGCQFMRTVTYGDDIRDTASKCFAGCGTMTVIGTTSSWTLKLNTSGDAVVVDFAQVEPQYWATSPIVGTSRAQDVVTAPSTGWPTTAGYFEALMTPQWTPQNNDTVPGYYTVFDTTPTNGVRLYHQATVDSAHTFVRNAGAASTELTSAWFGGGGYNAYPTPVVPLLRPRMWRTAWSLADNRLGMQGFTWIGPVARTEMPTGQGTAHFGALYDSTLPWNGWMAFPRVGTVVADQHIKVATIGDSILDGANTVKVGEAIQFALGWDRYIVRPLALSGARIATGTSNCVGQVGTSGPGSLGPENNVVVYNCGVNDILAGSDGPTTFALAQTLLNGLLGSGQKVAAALITPCGGYSGCGSTPVDAYNALLTTWCNARPGMCALVDAPSLVWNPANHAVLSAACDVNPIGGAGDHLHLSDACSIIYANALAAAVRTLAH